MDVFREWFGLRKGGFGGFVAKRIWWQDLGLSIVVHLVVDKRFFPCLVRDENSAVFAGVENSGEGGSSIGVVRFYMRVLCRYGCSR